MKFKVQGIVFDEPNHNGRIYTKEVVDSALENIKERGSFFVTLGPPSSYSSYYDSPGIDRIAAKIDAIYANGDGLEIEATMLDTPCGNTLGTLLNNNVEMYFTPSGVGKIDAEGVVSDYKDDFHICKHNSMSSWS
jgi:hypothetical protein